MLHHLLERQLQRLSLEEGTPPSREAWTELIDGISRAYEAVDRERHAVEQSAQLASREMQELNAKFSREHDKLTSVFRAAPVGLVTADREGCVLDFNQALEGIIGLPTQEAIGRFIWDFMPAEDVAAAQMVYRDLIAGKLSTNREQRRLVAKDGHVVHADVGLTAVRNDEGTTKLVIASVEDVTSRSRLEVEAAPLPETGVRRATCVRDCPRDQYADPICRRQCQFSIGRV